MTADRLSYWKSLRKWSPALFLLGGGLIVGHATLRGIQAFTELPTPIDAFGPTGYLLALLGLYGLYPDLVDRSPKLARIGVVSATLGAIGFSVIALGVLTSVLGVISGEPPAWVAAFVVLGGIGMLGGFPLFASAILRTDVHSRTIGLLLLMPVIIIAVMFSGILHTRVDGTVANFVLASGQAVSHLAIGVALRVESPPTGQAEPRAQPTTK